MIPILYDKSEQDFVGSGICFLSDCTKCEVTEERNGVFEIELQYPLSGRDYKSIENGCIIKAKANEKSALQLFRIYQIDKPLSGMVTVHGEHISYDLNGLPCDEFVTKPITLQETFDKLLSECKIEHNFTATAESTSLNVLSVTEPCSIRSCLGGRDGSILDKWGGEYEFDNYHIILHQRRGTDTDITIEYGKNLSELESESNISDCYTHIMPYAKYTQDAGDNDNKTTQDVILKLDDPIVKIEDIESFGHDKVLPVDLTDMWEQDEPFTKSKLREKTEKYVSTHNLGSPKVSLDISFVQLWQTEEYKAFAPLERVSLCDTLTVKYNKLGVNVRVKVIKYTYDSLLERYVSMELGNSKSNFASTILKTEYQITKIGNILQEFKVENGEFKSQITKTVEDSENHIMEVTQSTIDQKYNEITLSVTGRIDGLESEIDSAVSKIDMSIIRDESGKLIGKLDMEANQVSITSDEFSLKDGVIKSGSNGEYAQLWKNGLTFFSGDNSIATFLGNSWVGTDAHGLTCAAENSAKYLAFTHRDNPNDDYYNAYLTINFGLWSSGARVQVGESFSVGDWFYVGGTSEFNGYATFNAGAYFNNYNVIFTNSEINMGNTTIKDGEIVVANGSISTTHIGCDTLECGGLTCTGEKNRIVNTKNYGTRKLYAYETASPYFGDLGTAKTDNNCICRIKIDSIFIETVNTNLYYYVFLQSMSKSHVWTKYKGKKYIIIESEEPNTRFDFEVKIMQFDGFGKRLEVYNGSDRR